MKSMEYPLNQIYFYLTSSCNLRCRHCWISPVYSSRVAEKGRSLPLHLFDSILEQAAAMDVANIKLTGGEPLLHPEIEEILNIVAMRQFSLSLETNGILCTPRISEKIARCRDAFVSVSLDGTNAETHDWVRGTAGSFDKALAGIRNLVATGLKPQIIMTVLKKNSDQIEAMTELAASLGAGSVKVNVLQPTARAEALIGDGTAPDIRELLELGRWVEGTLSATARLPVFFHQPPAFRPLSKMFGADGDGCSSCGILNIIGVLAGGSYALCGIGETVPEMTFADAASVPLRDVWEETPVLREIRSGLPDRLEGICGDCLMRAGCLGSCLAQNYYRSRNLWAPFWYCEEARRLGLFPAGRLKPARNENA